jgi:hypothetical protein
MVAETGGQNPAPIQRPGKRMQATEKRKNPRRPVRYPATIEVEGGAAPLPCTLCDASDEGAQIQIKDPASLPDEFTLVLGYDGTARRNCKVMWRSDVQVGVEFKKPPKPESRPHPRSRAAGAARTSESKASDGIDIDSLTSR